MGSIPKLIIALVCLAIGVLLLIKSIRKYKKIDTESIAVVQDVYDLGRGNSGKMYAIRYEICSSTPFEILETPINKLRQVGAQRTIFYEKANPEKNYYFKTIGQFDSRMKTPIILIALSTILAITSIITLLQ
jgi:hypothetical protein